MFKTKRKRAVVLALIAFFCTAAVTYVAVDWKRFGGGFLAFLRGNGEQHLASSGGHAAGAGSGHIDDGATNHANAPSLPQMAAAVAHRKRLAGASGGSGHGKADDDLFTYGNPAAGGIPPGSFIVAQNDTPSGGGTGPSPSPSGAGEDSSSSGGGGVTSPAPAPTTGNGGFGDGGLVGTGKTPTTPPPPSSTPPAPPTTPPAPTQSGSTDTPPTPPVTPSPPTSLPPVSAVPEASSLAMMSLGALFLAVAAQRKRKKG